jgi:DNA recombination protein RmuC
MTIISMIHLIAYILKEDRLKTNAKEVQEVATELYKRLAKFVGDVSRMGKSPRVTVNHYNDAVGTLDSRLLPQARKISQLGAGSGDDLGDMPEIEVFPRGVLSPELGEPLEGQLSPVPANSLLRIVSAMTLPAALE